MLTTKENIPQIIPQRPPIVMIDQLISQEEKQSVTEFQIQPDGLFVRDGKLTEGGIIENIAQTAAAGAGYHYRKQGEVPPLGFIGAVSKVEVLRNPSVGETLRTVVEIKHEVFTVTLVQGTSFVGEEKIAGCEMKIVIDDPRKAQIH